MSEQADEMKSGIDTSIVPDVPTTCSPEDLPDEELLYDLADLFKVFSDTTRIKILYALMGRELCVADTSCARSSSRTWLNSDATGATSSTRLPTTMSTPCSTKA